MHVKLKLKQENKLDEFKLYSFDIFDTLVTRRLAFPKGIFAIIQENLKDFNIPNYLKDNFAIIRSGAEEYVHENIAYLQKRWEISFDEIYKLIQDNYNLSEETIEKIKEVEINTEIQNLVIIPENFNKLKFLINNGKKVVLISDMYYSCETLNFILSHLDPIFKNITIYSSSDYKVSKAEGKLYEIVKQKEQVQYSMWKHIGDNNYSDVIVSKRYKIKSELFAYDTLLNFENYLLKDNDYNKLFQLTIGTARLCRLIKKHSNEHKIDAYKFGCSFAGPLLFGYVNWIINKALEKNFKTVYFIARDGYILKIIADIIIESNNLNIKTKYLYGSRLAWRIPSSDGFENYIDDLFEEYADRRTIKFLSYRLGVKPQVLATILNVNTITTIINDNDAKKYAHYLKNNICAKQQLLAALESKRELLKAYFEQEIDFSEKNIAFVDLQGTGRTQDYISNILNEISECTITTLYFNNDARRKQLHNSKKYAYYTGYKYFHWWIELLGRTKDGQTIGFKKDNNTIVPILENSCDQILKWGINDYISGVKDFTLLFIDTLKCNKRLVLNNYLEIYFKFVDYLYNDLDKNLATLIGTIPWSTIGKEDKKIAAKELTLNRAFYYLLLGKYLVTDFPYISIARSCYMARKIYKFNLFMIQKYGSLRKFLINIYISNKKQKAFIRIFGIKISFAKLIWRNK